MKECKGLYLRYRKSVYTDSNYGIVTKEELYPLKRMSCKNENCKLCVVAQWQEDMDTISYDIKEHCMFDCVPKDGDIFETTLVSRSYDYWEYRLSKYTEKE